MDKYAIDIDKILNDFEFNELLVTNTIAETIATRVTVAPSLKQTEVDVNTPIVPVSNKPDVVPTNDDGEPDEQRIQNSCSDANADNKVTVNLEHVEVVSDEYISHSPLSHRDSPILSSASNQVNFNTIEVSDDDIDDYIEGLDDKFLVVDKPHDDDKVVNDASLQIETKEELSVVSVNQNEVNGDGDGVNVNQSSVDISVGEVIECEDKSRSKRPNTLDIVPNYNFVNQWAGSTPFATSSSLSETITSTTDSESIDGDSSTMPIGTNAVTEIKMDEATETTSESLDSKLGVVAPFWIPDNDAMNCMHCSLKFNLVKRRHHCRSCGCVLCSKCCNMKHFLQYLNAEARICQRCYDILSNVEERRTTTGQKQQAYTQKLPPPPVTGVLKRNNSEHRISKSVTFCDGIKPGHVENVDAETSSNVRNEPFYDTVTKSYISSKDGVLPPIVTKSKLDVKFEENIRNDITFIRRLRDLDVDEDGDQDAAIVFALQKNFYVHVRIVQLDCCLKKLVWSFMSDGLIYVGQDEIVYVFEFDEHLDQQVPIDVFLHYNDIYKDAVRGKTLIEMGLSLNPNLLRMDMTLETGQMQFLGSKDHAGFIYIRRTYQCMQNLLVPKETYLIGILIHKWEIPWAKILPLRLILRLGALHQFYPTSVLSVRCRDSVYAEIGHTIIKILADFRDFSYTLASVKGLNAYMEDKNVIISIPKNRYNQLLRILDESSDHIVAFATNFCKTADSHLVCIQNFDADESASDADNVYSTQAISILNHGRKKTGLSFLVFNGVLKSNSGLKAKSTIVEDGLMVQITSEQMMKLRETIRNMENYEIQCGLLDESDDDIDVNEEFIKIIWTPNDTNFNLGVLSPIDNMSFSGVPSIRVHSGKDYVSYNCNKKLRWTEVFIIQNGVEVSKNYDPVDVSKLAENISEAVYRALVGYLELLASNSCTKIGIRASFNADQVSYLAGSNNLPLSDIYMNSLDNELVPVLHTISTNTVATSAVLELIFHILNA